MTQFKSGDLVIVVAGDAFPESIGRVLTLTKKCDVWPDSWDTEPPYIPPGRRLPMSFWEPTLRLVRGQGVLMKREDLAGVS